MLKSFRTNILVVRDSFNAIYIFICFYGFIRREFYVKNSIHIILFIRLKVCVWIQLNKHWKYVDWLNALLG